MKLVVATSNPGKLRELRALLGDRFEIICQSDLGVASAEETGTSFEDNALLKARHAAAITGLPALADDSGLEVDALDGAPGVYSARYGGSDASDQDRLELLLTQLEDTPPDERMARFQCVIALVERVDEAPPLLARGTWEGRITTEPRGEQGFGYDPIFQARGQALTAAQMSPEDKQRVSHRARAMADLLIQLNSREP